MAKLKTHTLIVRGMTKAEKDSLKRIAKKSLAYTSVNQIMLGLITEKTASEIAEFKQSKIKP